MIEGNSLRSITKIVAEARGAREVSFIFPRGQVSPERQEQLGLTRLDQMGDSIVPSIVGKFSEFNSRGREIVRRDLPLVKKSVPSYRTWKDWHGHEHSGVQHRTMDVYQRDYVPAPDEVFILSGYVQHGCFSTRCIDIFEEDEQQVLHLANLMLEAFGSFQLYDHAAMKVAAVPFRRLQWEVLPPGKYPWKVTKDVIGPYLARLDPSDRGVIEERMRLLAQYEPEFLATGKGGYSGYFVYGFESREIYVLESVHLNNATYIFGDDWEELSSLTKDQIINGGVYHKRVVHDKKWHWAVRNLMAVSLP
ncbi:hypothetical protein FQZ97_474070 [compost metagenome]